MAGSTDYYLAGCHLKIKSFLFPAKSLDLLFGKDYLLNIREDEKEFEVQLTIPIYENKMLSH